jgi:Flp pilus assembly protein TadG
MMQFASSIVRGARKQCQRLASDRSGSVIALLAVLPVLAGAVAIGIETGQLYRVKRQMQNSADAAALAGSIDRMAGKTTTVITTTARYEAQRNGFTNGTNGVTVTVNAPPTSGSNMTTTGAVEVIVTKTMSFSLGAVLVNWLGGSSGTFTISSRSVAAQGSYSMRTSANEACFLALTTGAEQGVSLTGFNNMLTDCTIASNGTASSNNSSASIYLQGTHATLKSVYSKGSFYSTATTTVTNPAQVSQTASVADPYASLGTPSPGACTTWTPPSGNTLVLSPGSYCGGLTIDGSVYNNVYLTAGTYYMAGGDFIITGANNVTCTNCTDGVSGVTIVLTLAQGDTDTSHIGGFFMSGVNNSKMSAPPTGTYAGVLVYQDRRAPVGTRTSTAKIFNVVGLNRPSMSGTIYFPNNLIASTDFNNQMASNTGCTVWIGRYINFSNYNNGYIAGCTTFGSTPATVTTTTTVSKGKVFE